MSRNASATATGVPASAPNVAPAVGLIAGACVLISVLALAGLTYFEFANWDKVTPGVSAFGVQLGGATTADVVSRVSPGVQVLLDRPLQIRAADHSWNTTARALGLRLEPSQIATSAFEVGRQGNPFDRLGHQLATLVHGRSISPASTTDAAALDASLAKMAREIERGPRNAKLTLSSDGQVQFTPSEQGLVVDIPASRERIAQALSDDTQAMELVVRPIPPAIPDSQFETARDQLDRLLAPSAAPFTLIFGEKSWMLERPDIVKLLSIQGGTRAGLPASVNIDEEPLHALAARIAKNIDQTVQDARFLFNGGNLKVLRESREGRRLDQDATVSAIKSALLAGERSVALPVNLVEPAVSSANPQALGIRELIDRGSTAFAGSIPEKKHNIKLAAQRLNGVVVPPGGTFSFNQEIGPTTLDAGFQWGFGITAGDGGPKTVPSVAGGICQVATTLFQPVFWAGYQLEERYWHLYWIPAYTSRGVVGLDVTVDSDSNVDFKWTNPTNDYVLIQADSDDERVYFGLYGNKPAWKVEVDEPAITNRTPPDPKPLAQPEQTLAWGRTLVVETARDGFDVEVKRRVIPLDGSKPRELDLHSTYQPAHTVTLVGTAGKPANASLEEALQRVLEPQKPAEPTPAPTVTATEQAQPGPTAAPAVEATPVPATPKPAATPVPSNQRSGIAPTPTPAH
jgi:vancomycin resistance protein YoaR